jgi:hypothetical protein
LTTVVIVEIHTRETIMRTFELRVYTLRTKEALDFYRDVIYPRHLESFPQFGIEAHGFWTAKEDVKPRLFVLASYAAGDEPGEVATRYMQSTEFADDIRDFNVPTSLALNQRFSCLPQVLRSSDGEKEKTNEHDKKLG